MAQAPDIPTFAEMALPSLSWSGWYGLFAPKGTPKEIVPMLTAAVVEALPLQDHDAGARRVHPALRAACLAEWLSPHPPSHIEKINEYLAH